MDDWGEFYRECIFWAIALLILIAWLRLLPHGM